MGAEVTVATRNPTGGQRALDLSDLGSVLLAGSPLLDGVTGRFFSSENQQAEVVRGGPGAAAGVAAWSVDPAAADRLWAYALTATADH
ncbi:hypothetical protein ACIBI9_06265 [Nonomuraea sp. NPDC050451]|uniref:hypothetical protein n=1 Tax=Nonomuraea sp. NPDC050451 TaxID=3364364 RepID=UPI0037A6DACD